MNCAVAPRFRNEAAKTVCAPVQARSARVPFVVVETIVLPRIFPACIRAASCRDQNQCRRFDWRGFLRRRVRHRAGCPAVFGGGPGPRRFRKRARWPWHRDAARSQTCSWRAARRIRRRWRRANRVWLTRAIPLVKEWHQFSFRVHVPFSNMPSELSFQFHMKMLRPRSCTYPLLLPVFLQLAFNRMPLSFKSSRFSGSICTQVLHGHLNP